MIICQDWISDWWMRRRMIQITRKQNNNGTAYLMVWIFKGKGGLLRGSLKEWDEWDKQNLHANNCTYLYFSCSKYSQIKSLLISWSLANMKLLIGCGVERWMNAIKLVRIIFNRQQQQSLPIYQRQQQPVHQKQKNTTQARDCHKSNFRPHIREVMRFLGAISSFFVGPNYSWKPTKGLIWRRKAG